METVLIWLASDPRTLQMPNRIKHTLYRRVVHVATIESVTQCVPCCCFGCLCTVHSVLALDFGARTCDTRKVTLAPGSKGTCNAGVALRPGFIHGVRKWGTISIPLSAVGSPLESMLSFLPTKTLAAIPLAGAAFVPPVSVQKVAKAAVSAATDPGVPPGVMDVWTISKV